MDKPKFPEKPTQIQEIRANICDTLRIPRFKGAKTLKEWELEVILYWMERMVALKETKNPGRN